MIRDDHEQRSEEVSEGLALKMPLDEISRLQILLALLALSAGYHDDRSEQAGAESKEESAQEGKRHEFRVVRHVGHHPEREAGDHHEHEAELD